MKYLLLLFCTYHLCAAEMPKLFDWNTHYSIQIEIKESQYVSFMNLINLMVKEKSTGKILYQFQEEGIPLEFAVKTMNSQKFFFYSIHSGGESGGSITLRYLSYNSKGQILNQILGESPASFKFVDVDKDGKEEIVTRNLQFEWFEVEPNCHIIGFYAEYFDSPHYFFPQIFMLEDHKFVDRTFKFKKYLQDYLAVTESLLTKENEEKNYLAGFIQYFYVASQLGKAKQALTFIKKNNKPFRHYHCRTQVTTHTTVYDFIHTHASVISAQ